MTTIAIIGAGFSALTVAQQLKDSAEITLFEKSRGVGGRLCSRRAEPFSFDHGTQFFTVKSSVFRDFLKPIIAAGVVQSWHARFVEFDAGKITKQRHWDDSEPHYVGTPTMSAIGKYLQQGLTIHLNTRVGHIKENHHRKSHWSLYDNDNHHLGDYDWVICSAPAAQTMQLVPNTFRHFQTIQHTTMLPCFSLMLGFQSPLTLPFDAVLIRHLDISWISVNSSKPQRQTPFSLLIHSTNRWASEHIDDERNEVANYLHQQSEKIIGRQIKQAVHRDLQGFRYANISKQNNPLHYLLDEQQQLAVCGDWLIQGRVEAAFLSGHALANKLADKIVHNV